MKRELRKQLESSTPEQLERFLKNLRSVQEDIAPAIRAVEKILQTKRGGNLTKSWMDDTEQITTGL